MEDNVIDIRFQYNENNNKKYRYFTYCNFSLLWISYLGFILLDDDCNFTSLVPPDNYPLFFTIFSNCNKCIDLRYQIWRLYTYSFVHFDITHLSSNSIFLFIFSYLIETKIGTLNIFIIHFYGTITAPLCCILFIPYKYIIGSSAGVYSLFGIVFGIGILDYYNFTNNEKKFYLILIFILSIMFSTEIYYFIFNHNVKIAYYGHLSGLVYGVILTNIIIKPKKIMNYHKYSKIISYLFFIIINIILIVNYIFLYSAKKNKFSNKCCYIK